MSSPYTEHILTAVTARAVLHQPMNVEEIVNSVAASEEWNDEVRWLIEHMIRVLQLKKFSR